MNLKPSNPDDQEALDAATARRLARLGQRATDVSRLESRLDAALDAALDADARPADEPVVNARPIPFSRWLRPAAGIAAVLALVATLFLAVGTHPPQVSAAVIDLSHLHADIMAGRVPLTVADSVSQANAWIASQQSSAPKLPDHLAGARVHSCCLTNVQGELVAVALLHDGDVAVTLVVAKAPKFAHEMGTVIEIDGRSFFGHELNGIRMMMANQGENWLCVMGDATYEELARIAAAVRFGHDG